MNKQRRKRVDDVIVQIEELAQELNDILEEETEYMENIPENLLESERYENAATNCENLQSALDSLEEVSSYLEESKN